MLKRLLYMNGLAILAVVLNHARVWGIIAMVFWADRYKPVTVPDYSQVGSTLYYGLLLLDGIIQFAIPTFLFGSGFFIAIATGRSKSTIPWRVVLTRIKFLVIPYLVWFVVMSGVLFLEGRRGTMFEYVKLILTGYIQGPYYFVPLLVQLYLLSPSIVRLARSNWRLLLIGAAIIQMMTQGLLYCEIFQVQSPVAQFYVLPLWFFPTRLFWFVLGIVVGLHLQAFKVLLERTRWLFLVLIFVSLGFSMFERNLLFVENITIPVETTISSLYALSVICVMIGYSNVSLPLTWQVERTAGKAFGIYLTHAAAQEYTSRIIYHIAPGLLGHPILFISLIFGVGIGIPNVLMEGVRRSPARRYYQYVFG